MQQKIALFGAAGAIGRSIAEALRKRGGRIAWWDGTNNGLRLNSRRTLWLKS